MDYIQGAASSGLTTMRADFSASKVAAGPATVSVCPTSARRTCAAAPPNTALEGESSVVSRVCSARDGDEETTPVPFAPSHMLLLLLLPLLCAGGAEASRTRSNADSTAMRGPN